MKSFPEWVCKKYERISEYLIRGNVHRQTPTQIQIKSLVDYTQYTASGTGLVGRYQNFERLDGTVDIKFPK